MPAMPPDYGKKLGSFVAFVRGLDPRVAAVAIVFLLFAVALFAACGGCDRRAANPNDAANPSASGSSSSASSSSKSAPPLMLDAASLRDPLLWGNATSGELEDLASLASHEGAMGLVEATTEPTLRPTAIRAMGYARGWAQLPFLAKTAGGKDEEEARLALDATFELAVRQRRAEDPEDAEELALGCEALNTLARDVTKARPRRVGAIRALRMMPCPPSKQGELPTDVDSK
jgi:hypothetical protein